MKRQKTIPLFIKLAGSISLVFLAFLNSHAQDTLKTYHLDAVTVSSLLFEKFASGSKIQQFDSIQKNLQPQSNLSDFLLQNTGIYLKEYGNGGLSTIAMRGTGAGHTAVMWNGINLNSMTLGESNFSNYPIFLFDGIEVQYGGASSLHGSDAIGGSVHLVSRPSWTKGLFGQLQQDIGSFGNYFSGLKLRVGNGHIESKTTLFNFNLKNDFNYAAYDRLGEKRLITQENAALHNYGLLQEINYRFPKSSYISVKGWYGYNFREVQPLMVNSPDEPQDGNHILDKNLRLTADYHLFMPKGSFHSSLAYVRDYELFNDTDRIVVGHAEGTADYEWDINDKTLLNVGAKSQYIVPRVDAYADSPKEWREDVYASFRRSFTTNLLATLNVRKAFVPQLNAPVAPSLSLEYTFPLPGARLKTRAIGEKSYRIPTFNERYWRDQGKKDLRPEEGYNYEIGANYLLKKGRQKLELDASTYFMRIDDWIAWQPTTFLSDRNGDGIAETVYDWRPSNLKKVSAKGLELSAKYSTSLNQIDLDFGSNYALNETTLLEGMSEDDPSVGHQLPYTPMHRLSAYATAIWKKSSLNITGVYVGKRTGTDIVNDQLPDYALVNASLNHQIALKTQRLTISGTVKNLFNIAYQNIKNQAMPGRNYLVSLRYYF